MKKPEYSPDRSSLYHPGKADNFFQLTPCNTEKSLCAEFSRLAYLKDEKRLKIHLKNSDFQLLYTFGYRSKGTQMFLASNNKSKVLIAAFRGTETSDLQDLVTDLAIGLVPWQDDQQNRLGKVHSGFATAILSPLNSSSRKKTVNNSTHGALKSPSHLLGHLKEIIDNKTGYTRYLTGHSLGGALATLAGSWIPEALVYTYGSPRVGNKRFTNLTSHIRHKRFVHCCDLIPRIPPAGLGYWHHGDLHYINSDGEIWENPHQNKIRSDRKKGIDQYRKKYQPSVSNVLLRELADHSPVNYLRGVAEDY